MASSPHVNFSGARVVIAGCGYLGAAAATTLQASGAHVVGITRNSATAAALQERGIAAALGDLASADWHSMVPPSADFFLNCVSSGGGGLQSYRHSYLDGMRSIVRWLERATVGTIVYTSSTSVYPQDGGSPVDETAPTVLPSAGDRGGILVATEQLLAQARGASRWFVLRLAGLYGPSRRYLADQVLAGTVSGVPGHRVNLVHRDDAVAAVLACFAAPAAVAGEVYNVADDQPTRKDEIVAWMARRAGVPVPAFTGLPAGGRRAVTPDRIIVNRKLKQQLGWAPMFPSFREGYAALV
jgi:nucleoside-diphosphate-sugar epimerase